MRRRHPALSVLVLALIAVVCFYNAHRIIAEAGTGNEPASEPQMRSHKASSEEDRIDQSFNPGDVNEINISQVSRDVQLLPSGSGEIEISYLNGDNDWDKVEVSLNMGVLSVSHPRQSGTSIITWGNFFPQISWGNDGLVFSWDESNEYNVIISIPAQFSGKLKASTVSGTIEASDGRFSRAEFKSTSGNINIWNITAPALDCTSVSGSINAENVTTDDASIKTTSGDISLSGDVENIAFSTISGRVNLAGKLRRIDGKTTSGDLDLTSDTNIEETTLTSISGTLKLEIPNDNPTVSFKSISGDIRGDLGVVIGNTTPLITVKTTSGDLIINKR